MMLMISFLFGISIMFLIGLATLGESPLSVITVVAYFPLLMLIFFVINRAETRAQQKEEYVSPHTTSFDINELNAIVLKTFRDHDIQWISGRSAFFR